MDIPNCYYRVSIKALVLDDDKKFLLLKEKNGNWDLPGGGLEFGDSPHDTLKREIYEEMGVVTSYISDSPVYIVTSLMDRNSSWGCNILYETKLNSLDFKPSEECIDFGYFNADEASKLSLNKKVAEFIKVYDPINHKPKISDIG